MKSVRILVVDDNDSFRTLICSLFTQDKEIELVGEGKNGEEAILRNRELHPDVVLIDLEMPGIDGIEATKLIKEAYPGTKVAILSACDDEQCRIRAEAAGANGYFLKGNSVAELMKDIKNML